ncbi:MAG: site-2 protease family protein, partial [Nitrospirae bacterium]|nr:site-2 protease family protein [Nitrospirota bacterium]
MFRNSIKLGTILGITIRLDYSWFIIFFLITWSLSAHRLPLLYPDWPQITYWTIGIITSILFFTSVLIHEMAHSLVARKHGIPVNNITLFIFGGAAQITQEPKQAKDEFMMAFAGPAASLVLSAIFWILYLLLRSLSEPIATIFSWLGSINLMLAIFNFIPGFPLDGGRVLRAIVWGATQDFARATQIAAAIGRGIAFLFIFIGIWMIFGGNWVNGLWIAFIGWFLENAATTSYRQVALKDMLQGHTVKE